jgi:hypothetical protein
LVTFVLPLTLLIDLGCESAEEKSAKLAKEEAVRVEADKIAKSELYRSAITIIGECKTLPDGYITQFIKNNSNTNFTTVALGGSVRVMQGLGGSESWPFVINGKNVTAGAEGNLTGHSQQLPVLGFEKWNYIMLTFDGPNGPERVSIDLRTPAGAPKIPPASTPTSSTASASIQSPLVPTQVQVTAPTAEVMARTSRLEATLQADPKNHDAWVALGNEYFDSHQAQKSVDAYGKALALAPADPNVLCDQGVMYRDLGQFDKALVNFQKANRLDPNHTQSLFNMGLLYAQNLHRPEEAAKALDKVIAAAPASEQAAQARKLLANLKK